MFVISSFTSRNGVCKLLYWKEIKVEFLSLLHDPFLCKLVLLVNSASLFYLVSFRVSGMPRINSLYDPSVLVTKEILSGPEKSNLHWLSLLWSILRFIYIARYSKFTTPPNQQAQISIISLTQHRINLAQICQTDIWKFQIIHLLRSRVESRGRRSKVAGGQNDLREI